ncbi:MAG: hypothetical protein IPM23_24830 [Candidatus Melainabacteria bacterium]|nr:hypothetical protein [Candidatus Melainabacteria bacterium]
MEALFVKYGLYVIGVAALVGGFELAKWAWHNSPDDESSAYDPSYNSWFSMANIGVGAGIALIALGFYCFYGGYQGWSAQHVLSSTAAWVGSFLDDY